MVARPRPDCEHPVTRRLTFSQQDPWAAHRNVFLCSAANSRGGRSARSGVLVGGCSAGVRRAFDERRTKKCGRRSKPRCRENSGRRGALVSAGGRYEQARRGSKRVALVSDLAIAPGADTRRIRDLAAGGDGAHARGSRRPLRNCGLGCRNPCLSSSAAIRAPSSSG